MKQQRKTSINIARIMPLLENKKRASYAGSIP